MLQNRTILIGCGALLVVVILIVVIIAIGSGGGGGKNQELKKVTMWTPIDSVETYEAFVNDFKQANKGAEVTIVKKDLLTYEDELVNAIAAGTGPDVFMLRNDWIPKHLGKLVTMPPPAKKKKNATDPADDYKNSYIPQVYQENVIDGKIYGKPLAADPLVLYVNYTDLYDLRNRYTRGDTPRVNYDMNKVFRYGPSTWDEFELLAKLARSIKGKKINYSGAALGTTSNLDTSVDILYLMMLQNGAKFTDDNKKMATFHLPTTTATGGYFYPGTKALNFYTSFAMPYSSNYNWSKQMPRAIDAFIDGKTLMFIDYASQEEYIKQIKTPSLSYIQLPVPQIRGATEKINYARYWTFVVNRNSKSPIMSWNWINYLNGSSVLYSYLKNVHGISARKQATSSGLLSGMASVGDQLQTAKGIYKSDAKAYDKIMKEMIDMVLGRGQGAQNAIESAATKVTALLNR